MQPVELPSVSLRELVTSVHGMAFGGLFLLAFTGGLVAFSTLRDHAGAPGETGRKLRLLQAWVLVQALCAWLATLVGALTVYPWYRAKAPLGADLGDYPQGYLMHVAALSGWHSFGMEWKEHLGWFAPILATCVAYLVFRCGDLLVESKEFRSAWVTLYSAAFAAAAVAGILGAEIAKAAPIH
jgi:hypothetical protein